MSASGGWGEAAPHDLVAPGPIGAGSAKDKGPPRKLSTFDVTSLVVGSIIGADVYVATAIGARLVGPASLLVWVLAGAMAGVIALSFSYCVMFLPKVGGPYAYVKAVSGPFGGFMVGWGLLLAEWFSLAVFPVAFTQYFSSFVPGIDDLGKALLKAVFIGVVLGTNIVGVKLAGRVNDLLTIAKLSPLILVILGGLAFIGLHPAIVASNLTPFVTGNLGAFGQALVLIFWAYAGFELSTLPADEIERPARTIPRAIALGMLIVIGFYLLTNFVVVGSVSQSALANSSSPLILAASSIFASPAMITGVAVLIVGAGALLSITGADESGTIGTSRLAYAMSIDGLLPKAFSRKDRRFRTPYVGLALLCGAAFVASLFGSLGDLINASVFLLAVAYFATCVSAILLEKRHPRIASRLNGRIVFPLLGAAFSLLLIALVNPRQVEISLFLFAVGIPVYAFFSPRQELHDLREAFLSIEAIEARAQRQGTRFLAYAMRAFRSLIHRVSAVKDR